ncbi:hypothetical protein Cs7R123_76060 [Catellatospora sp. TT07R-123]|uniref:DUF4245 family protein n=1 Tax=Catellatospora sp. TT07R-123 TaxID=2733863 RepID=UPI001B2CBF0A|nr:DUF4245 family protein [Catellatospora sp. TT07R-123]GHJ50264.1 hypothetical protein Cs7R123_76060 [Catellatospora sp. TT07R-123]
MSTAPVETQPAQVPASGGRTPKDMALSLGVLLVPVLLLVLGYRLFYGWNDAVTVDPTAAIESAGRASMAPLPGAVAPDGWQTVTAKWADGKLRIGYLDPDNRGARLVQARIAAAELVKAELGDKAQPGAQESVGGVTWQRYHTPDDEDALVRTSGDTAILLVGRGVDLVELAAAVSR